MQTIGTQLNGKPALLRDDVAPHIAPIFAAIKHRTDIDLYLRIIQAYGTAKASAGVHESGTCIDIRTRGLTSTQINELVFWLRVYGFAATWYRDWKNNQHIHAAAYTTIASNASYQIRDVISGKDGTDRRGPDYHKRPTAWRTITQGAALAAQYITKETGMDPDKLAASIMAYEITANGKRQALAQHLATLFVETTAQSNAVAEERARDRDSLTKILASVKNLTDRLA